VEATIKQETIREEQDEDSKKYEQSA